MVSDKEENERVTANIMLDGQEIIENINDNESETKDALVKELLNMHKTASNETIPISEIPNIIHAENVVIALGQEKILASISSDQFCKERALSYLFLAGKFGYNATCNISIDPARYFALFHEMENVNIFSRSVYEQHHLYSSMTFAMLKIKPKR